MTHTTHIERSPLHNTTPSAGEILRNKREQNGWVIEDVARHLNLTNDQVRKLETDDYRYNPGIVFIRGYLRAYARLLDLDAKEILAAFERLGIEDPAVLQEAIPDNKNIGINERHYRWVTYLIILGLLVLTAMWWQTDTPRFLRRAHHVLHRQHVQAPTAPPAQSPEQVPQAFAEIEAIFPQLSG